MKAIRKHSIWYFVTNLDPCPCHLFRSQDGQRPYIPGVI